MMSDVRRESMFARLARQVDPMSDVRRESMFARLARQVF
jgi:hypothetical protein